MCISELLDRGCPLPLVEVVKKGAAAGLTAEEILTEMKEKHRTREAIQAIEVVTRHQASSQLWHDHRRGMVTASIAHTCMTRSVTLLKSHHPPKLEPLMNLILRTKTVQTQAMLHGIRKEATAIDSYTKKLESLGHKLSVQTVGLVVLPEAPFIGCSPDGIVSFQCACCMGTKVLLEVKCPTKLENAFLNFDAKSLKRDYETQVNVQMGVCNVKRTHFFVFVDTGCNSLIELSFDAGKFQKFVSAVSEVYTRYVVPEFIKIVLSRS